MRYELIENSNAGVIIDPTPILLDIKDTFKVSFVLPEDGSYIALFRGEDNSEYKVVIKDNVAIVPKQLFKKEQRVGLTVCQVDSERIIHAWECHSLRIGAFLYLRQTQWQVTACVDDRELFERIAELERSHAETQTAFETLQAENTRCMEVCSKTAREHAEQVAELTRTLASVKKVNETLVDGYNNAIKVINDLSERVKALEKNYDPTIIN